MQWMRHGKVYAEVTLCGRPRGVWQFGHRVIDRPDWHLIYRRDEPARVLALGVLFEE